LEIRPAEEVPEAVAAASFAEFLLPDQPFFS
jgi:hypothetical protein